MTETEKRFLHARMTDISGSTESLRQAATSIIRKETTSLEQAAEIRRDRLKGEIGDRMNRLEVCKSQLKSKFDACIPVTKIDFPIANLPLWSLIALLDMDLEFVETFINH